MDLNAQQQYLEQPKEGPSQIRIGTLCDSGTASGQRFAAGERSTVELTHVRKVVGYRRFDTTSELRLLNETFAELRLYKNFSVIANLDTLTGGQRETAEQSEGTPPDR